MARRTWAQLAALLADNSTGEISEADLRDAVIDSAMPHVEARPPNSTDHEGAGFDVGHTWIDTSASPMPEAWRCVFSSPSAAIWSRIEGAAGAPGAAGTAWHTVTSAPDESLGNVGDYALDSVTFNVYEKTDATTWELLGNLKGPPGEEGPPGEDGGIQPEDGVIVVKHGANASESRPTAAQVFWMGSIAPTNRVTGDLWLETGDFD